MFSLIKNKSDYIICADGAANHIYDTYELGKQTLSKTNRYIDCIAGDFSEIRPDVREYFQKTGAKEIQKKDEDTPDLYKCLYVTLERISEVFCEDDEKYSVIILGSSNGRFDETLSYFHNVFQLMDSYTQIGNTEIFMLSKSTMSVFLKNGVNLITPSVTLENRDEGYSVIPLQDPVSIKVTESLNNKEQYNEKREIKFGTSLFFRKKTKFDSLKIELVGANTGLVIYSTTTKFHS